MKRPIRNHEDRAQCRKTRHGAIHIQAPSGSKLLKGFYKAKHGAKASAPKDDKGNVIGTAYNEALAWLTKLRLEPPKYKPYTWQPYAKR